MFCNFFRAASLSLQLPIFVFVLNPIVYKAAKQESNKFEGREIQTRKII